MPIKKNSRITSHYEFAKIKNIIALYFFKLIKNEGVESHKLVRRLKKDFKTAFINIVTLVESSAQENT